MGKYYSNKESNASDSEMFQGKIREEDLAQKEKLNELVKEANEFIKNDEFAKLEKQIYEEVHNEFTQLLSDIESYTDSSEFKVNEGLLQVISSWLENILGAVNLLNKKKNDEGCLFALLKRLFNRELSWEERLDQEIEELKEKLKNSELSKEERIEILERLKLLQSIKLSGITVVGIIFGIIASFIGFNVGIARSKEIVRETREKVSRVRESEQSDKTERETKNENKEETKFIMKDQEVDYIFRPLGQQKRETGLFDALMTISNKFAGIDNFIRSMPLNSEEKRMKMETSQKPAAIATPESKPLVKEPVHQDKQEFNSFTEDKRDAGNVKDIGEKQLNNNVDGGLKIFLQARKNKSSAEEKTQKPYSHVKGIEIQINDIRSR